MTVEELLQNVRANQVPELVFLYGQESYLMQRAARAIRKAVLVNDPDDFNDNLFFGKDATASQISEAAETLPIFAPRRMVTVKDAHQLPAAELELLLPYLKDPVPETCLLFWADKIDSRRKFFQQFKKIGSLVEFKSLTEKELPNYVRSHLNSIDRQMTADALSLFCAMVSGNLHEVHGELDKLITYAGERNLLDVPDVRAVISSSRVENIFELGNAVGRGEGGRALVLAKRLADSGEAPLKILSLLVRHFRQLWKVRELQVQNLNKREIVSGAGVPFFVIDTLVTQGKRFSRVDFQRAFSLFLATDLAMKSSGADSGALLESLLLTLSQKSGVKK